MKLGPLGYGIGFLFFAILVVAVAFQNLGIDAKFSFLWMNIRVFHLIFLIAILGIIQGFLFLAFIKSFFRGMQRPELTKFDLDKPL